MPFSTEDILTNLEEVNRDFNFNYNDIKKEQKKAIISSVQKQDVIAVLPTGFGKTFCFTAPSLILDKLEPEVRHMTLVISPLIALMRDHVAWLREHGVRTHMISSTMSEEDMKEIKEGHTQILFTSPEAILGGKWRKIVPKVYGERCSLVAYDEVHCISEWGLDFRPDYKQVSQIQNLISAPTLALTATATTGIIKDIVAELCLEKFEVIASLPDRANIYLDRIVIKENVNELQWVVDELKEKGRTSKKILIYVNYTRSTFVIYDFLQTSIGKDLFVDNIESSDNRLVDMYSAGTDTRDQCKVLERYKSNDGNLRVVIATTAFGMGIDIPDIDIVVHWGLPRTTLQYFQQAGRAGRDGRSSVSKLYIFPSSITSCTDYNMKQVGQDEWSECLRYKMLNLFSVNSEVKAQLEQLKLTRTKCTEPCGDKHCKCGSCRCCTYCKARCICSPSA